MKCIDCRNEINKYTVLCNKCGFDSSSKTLPKITINKEIFFNIVSGHKPEDKIWSITELDKLYDALMWNREILFEIEKKDKYRIEAERNGYE